jgi:hypothetical protein
MVVLCGYSFIVQPPLKIFLEPSLPCSESINEAASVQELASPIALVLLAFAMSVLRLQCSLVHQRNACSLSVPCLEASILAKASKLPYLVVFVVFPATSKLSLVAACACLKPCTCYQWPLNPSSALH